ncbi:MAG: hypothetical protein GF349_01605 [Candidatus Magasanikbacteria bacterium]|nr:hypothetical protein [Candidatus Magasanikbacteria bacterium]
MKKIIKYFFIALILFTFVPSIVFASSDSGIDEEIDKINFSLFHSFTCPHCKDEIEFINNELEPEYGEWVEFNLYEISDPENQKLLDQYAYFYKASVSGVPITFIDGQVVYGYDNEKTTGQELISIIETKLKEKGIVYEKDANVESAEKFDPSDFVTVPVIGEINAKTFSLPLLTVMIGLLDGFNPCAMWVLLFLISLLLGIENRKRMWILGLLFIVSSGLVYFFFMAAWLHFLMFVGMIFFVRIIIGLVAIGVGGYNLRDYWKNRKSDGVVCKVSNKEGTKKTFDKIKDIVYKKSLLWSITGIILLGFSVNLVELACSAGFPAIFTQILAISDVAMWKRYLYMAGYIFFYMLDDMIVFAIAMITLKSKVVGSKFAKYSNLIGGLIIFVLGLLLIFKPAWLMFS